jgi:lysophospholipase L1-like esterase
MRKSILFLSLLGALGLGASWASRAQSAAPARPSFPVRLALEGDVASADAVDQSVDPRWREDFNAFAAADRNQAPSAGGVVFVGSSSIRLWSDLESAFAGAGTVIVKRGFGGSRLLDCVRYLDRLVLPYRPRLVVVYAGDNDLAEGRSPQQVLESFSGMVDGVRRSLPGTRIAFVSIKPSPLRAALLPQVREANALIREHAARTDGLDYIDVYSGMVDADGQPRPELFQADRLHLNAQGYALWRQAIAPALRALPVSGVVRADGR